MTTPNVLPLVPLMSIAARVGAPVTIEVGAPGRRFIPILGGEVSGAMTGKVLEGGGDWQTVAADGTLEINAHYILDIDGHGRVEVRSDGLRHAPEDVLEALDRGEDVDPSLYYFRTAIRLRGRSSSRLNNILCLSRGRRAAQTVHLDVFEVG